MKKSSIFKLLATSFALMALVVACDDDESNPIAPGTSQAAVRVIHTSHDAPSVDVSVDGQVAISDLAYGEPSGYAELPAGTRSIAVTPYNQTSPVVISADLTLMENTSYTVFAVNELANIEPIVAVDARTPNNDKARVRFVHASPDAPAVDIKLNDGSGPAVFAGQAFKDVTTYAEVDAGSYTFAVTPAGATAEVIVFDPIAVQNGIVYTVVAHGTLDNSDAYPFAVRVFVDNNTGDGFVDMSAAAAAVKVVHASPDAPGVDLLLDGQKVNSSALAFPNNTGYLEVTAGDRNVKVNVANTSTSVIDATLNLDPNAAYSVFAVNTVLNIEPLVLIDDLATPAAGMAHARFVHLSPDAPAVDITLTDGTVVFGNQAFKEATAFTPLGAGTYDLQVRLAGTSTVVLPLNGITLENGKIYTVFAKGLVSGSGDQALGAEIIVNNATAIID